MNSDNALLHQPDNIQEQPSLIEKKSQLLLIVVVVPLLIIHLRYFGSLLQAIITSQFWLLGLLGSIPHFLALSILDLAVASFYFKEKSNRIWKTVFILIFIVHIIPFGWYLEWFIGGDFNLALFFEDPPHFVGLFLVDLITGLSYVIQRYSHRFSRLAKGIIYVCFIAAWLLVIVISFDPHRWYLITIDNTGY